MKIGIIGTGGVGGYFGARLAEAGNDVRFIARGKHLEAIQNKGLKVKSINGDMLISPAQADSNLDFLSECELVILGVKSWQVREIATQLSKSLNNEAMVLPLQNGVLAAPELCEFFNASQVYGGLCMVFSKIEDYGIINHMGFEPSITFGQLDGKIGEKTIIINKIFQDAKIKSSISEDIHAELWKKFMLICLSALGAITNSGYGKLRETAETREIIKDALTEIYEVAIAKGINLKSDIVETSLKVVDSYPADSMSSLARDVLAGKPSEIEYQNGTIIKFGKGLGISTPVNKMLYAFIKLMEA